MLRSPRLYLATAARRFSGEAYAAAVENTTLEAASGSSGTSGGGRDTLGRRLMSLAFPKRSAVIAIRKWQEEGHTVRKYELNRIVRELRKLKRYKHALEICEWMTLQKDMKLLPGDYAVQLDLISKIRGLSSAEKFFVDLPDKMRGQSAYTALLHVFVQNNLSEKAEALMAKMSEFGFLKSPLSFNHMLSLHIANKRLEKVPALVQELKKNTKPDVVTYNLLLNVCTLQNDVEAAENIFLEMKNAKIEPDWVSFSTLANLYSKQQLTEKAASTLKNMEKMASKRNRISFSSLLSLYTNLGDKDGVCRIWKKMNSSFRKMNDSEYMCMISSLVKLDKLEEAEKLYTEWESVSGTGDTRVPNILLAAYINKNQTKQAESFYDRMTLKGIVPSYTTWELLTWGYLKENQMEKVLQFFKNAVGSVKKWNADERLVKGVCKRLEEQGNFEGAEQLLIILRNAGHVDTEIYNSLLRTYAKAGKMPLIVAERMEQDNVQLNEESRELLKLTSKMCVSEVSSTFYHEAQKTNETD
ncbi:pentatricopeptide repeat-containing protein At4g02820, mitochondrial isoform X1 [Cucurbita pepo subsp. pepo]|uniref:pentatricopeptide repeat-containing protein At4g02820, mitochondrial isoform X1 n=2 Tax=Cucurbita pepo subsp. pepo TaxID=3664 RepID=UPI000C9D7CC7|nr:pentatricopeptide repeat-containing protein At4g02820, mitochondrial isoform X1 [Cucurbita pepo subsp. pepo]